ncbi:MAG: Fur family transcriptional regulator, partial [Bacteroidota bacterium]
VTLLKHHDLRLTQVRKEVLSVFLKKEQALSQSDIEENVGQIDRITLYRTLRSFEDNGLIHRAIDGTDKLRFALCVDLCDKENHKHNHAHFHCEKCTKTICLNGVEFPKIIHPSGFKVKETYYVMQGVCSKCQ